MISLNAMSQAAKPKQTIAKYEYATITIKPTTYRSVYSENHKANEFDTRIYAYKMDSLGSIGYELVSVVPITETIFPNFGKDEYHTGIKENVNTKELKLFFKRKL